ncbi:uncharacterized protein DS421_2g56110 [Arachis hypogaea]|nr:uncharacterized protein DS421_2g56110 [Arachis hypogaea]
MEHQRHNENLSAMMDSTGSFRRATTEKKKKFTAPTCNCGTYAILFESFTKDTPKQAFCRCFYFKTKAPHYNLLAWLDKYVTYFDGKDFIDVSSSNKLI